MGSHGVAAEPPAVLTIDVDTSDLNLISGRRGSTAGVLAVLRQDGRTLGVRRAGPAWTLATLLENLPASPKPPAGGARPSATVAICTLGSHPRLRSAVIAAVDQTVQDLTVLVVDNDPLSGKVRRALGEDLCAKVTIVEEARRGLSHARNRALSSATTEVLAFTDDDAIVERTWLEQLLEPFTQDRRIAAVTGLVLPAELRTSAQRLFESYVGFGKGTEPVSWAIDPDLQAQLPGHPGPRGVLFPWTTGKVGSGNSMAFRTSVLHQIDGFDEHLGAGAPAQGGEDLDAFTRVLLTGHGIAYTPHALVWHYHRESVSELERQIRANGVGMGALLAKSVKTDPRARIALVKGVVAVGRRALASRGKHELASDGGLPRALRWRLLGQEVLGLSQGPWKYSRASRLG